MCPRKLWRPISSTPCSPIFNSRTDRMADIAHTVHVALGERAYDILIGPHLLDEAGAILAERFPGRRYGVITDDNVAKAQLPRLLASLDAAGLSHSEIILPAGES